MKKWLILLLCAVLIMSMTACGGKAPAEPAAMDETETAKAADEGELTVTKFWKAAVPADLVMDDENTDEEDLYSHHRFGVKDGDAFKEYFSIEIDMTESPTDIRKKVEEYGLDLHAFAEKTLEDGMMVGGVYCAKYVDTWDDAYIFGRDEARQTSLTIKVQQDVMSKEDLARLLDSFELLTEDVGHEDAPYPWDGERLAVNPMPVTDGSYTLTAEPIIFTEPIVTYEVFDVDVAVAGEYLYVLYPGHILVYDAANPAESVGEIAVDPSYDGLQGCADGRLFVKAFMEDVLMFRGLEQIVTIDVNDIFAMATSGEFGYLYNFSNENESKIVVTEDGGLTKEPIQFVGADGNKLQGISKLTIADQTVGVTGSAEESSGQMLGIYDHAGKLIKALYGTDDESIGSLHGYVEGVDSYIGCDSNMRDIKIWNKEGELVAVIDAYDLTGTDYPWINNFQKMADGNIYMVLTEERDDDSGLEVMVYRVTVTP